MSTNPASQVWLVAAADLGIRVEAPFELRTDDGRVATCAAWLPDFGGPRGTVLASRFAPDWAPEAAAAAGYYTSGLNPAHYEPYDRARYVAALTDWGWYGDAEARPSWCPERRP